jgi:pimeloyl-ACP methyl ester carboxylesterase
MSERAIAVNGIELHVVEEGEGTPIVLCHGFPELARSWRHQIPMLVEAGYKVYAPDMRGFGRSSRPPEVEAYDIFALVGDVVGLLDAVGEDDAILVGHDWGATTVWHVALMHPERVRAVVGMSVPFVRRAPEPPMQILRSRFGNDFYQAWFQQIGPADELLARDIRRTVTATEDWTEEWAHRVDDPAMRPEWLTEEDLTAWVAALERSGLTGGLNYYRNIDRNWERTAHLDGRTIDQPALFITGSADIVRRFMPGRRMERWVTDLRGFHVIEGAGHWVQQERPAEVNALLSEFLTELETQNVRSYV